MFDELKGGIAGFGDRFEKAVQECPVETLKQTTGYMESLAEWVITGLTQEEQETLKEISPTYQRNMGLGK